MSQIIEAFEKYFPCVKLNMPRVVCKIAPPHPQDRVNRSESPLKVIKGEICIVISTLYTPYS